MAVRARILSILLIALLTFSQHAGAQTSIEAGGGISLARISGRSGYNRGFVSYQAGLLFNKQHSDRVALGSGLVLSRQGGNNEKPMLELRSLYLLAPLTIRYKVAPAFSLLSGPQVGIFLQTNRSELRGTLNPLDFSWVFGFQIDAHARLAIRVAYNVSLNPLGQAKGILEGSNRVIVAGLFVRIANLKKS